VFSSILEIDYLCFRLTFITIKYSEESRVRTLYILYVYYSGVVRKRATRKFDELVALELTRSRCDTAWMS
jgi:hypothetical protein